MEYEGTRYHGFQLQSNASSIQGELEQAIHSLTGQRALAGQRARVNGAGRTDAGVHAKGQVVCFDTVASLPLSVWVSGLNHYLPEDIAIVSAYHVPDAFNPRRHAISREYRYTIVDRATPSPLLRRFAAWESRPLNVQQMDTAVRTLIGTRDCAPFSGPLGNQQTTTVRAILDARVRARGSLVILDLKANAFLPQQVRRTAGALVQVGLGKMTPQQFTSLADSGVHGAASSVLPPQGLCLMKVNYRDFPPTSGSPTEG